MGLRSFLAFCLWGAAAPLVAWGGAGPVEQRHAARADTIVTVPPSLLSPADTARDIGARPHLLWRRTGDSAIYLIQVALDSAFASRAVDDSVVADTLYRVHFPLCNDSLYFWRVGVRDTGATVRFGPARSFYVAPSPGLSSGALDFGYVRRGDTTWATLLIRNPLPRPISVDSSWSGSGRFRFITPLPAVVDSLDSLLLVAAFIPADYTILVDTLRCRTDLGDPAVLVSGDSPPPLGAVGSETIQFPPIALTDTSVQTLLLHNRGVVNSLTIARFRWGRRTFHVLRRPPFRIPPRDSVSLLLRYLPGAVRPAQYGRTIDTLWIESDGGAFAVELRGESPPPRPAAMPSAAEFGQIAMGDTLWKGLTVTNRSLNPLRIDSLRIWNSAYRLTTQKKILRLRDSLVVPIRFQPQRYGSFLDTLLLFSNAPGSPFRIPVRGIAPAPELVPDHQILQFGSVPVREETRLVLGIANNSISPLVVDSIAAKGRLFRVERFPFFTSLRRGDTLRVGVTFTPDTTGNFRDTLLIYNNSPNARWRIPLFASGSPALRGDDAGPESFSLMQNFPNPFRGMTTFRYSLPERCAVKLVVYSSLGQIVGVVVDSEQGQGYQNVPWRTETASGMYFYKLIATPLSAPDKQYVATKRLMILR